MAWLRMLAAGCDLAVSCWFFDYCRSDTVPLLICESYGRRRDCAYVRYVNMCVITTPAVKLDGVRADRCMYCTVQYVSFRARARVLENNAGLNDRWDTDPTTENSSVE